MNIQEPKRQPFYCYLSNDAKSSLKQLVKYHRTTLTNLIEEGAHMVIRSHLKQIQAREYGQQQTNTINSSW